MGGWVGAAAGRGIAERRALLTGGGPPGNSDAEVAAPDDPSFLHAGGSPLPPLFRLSLVLFNAATCEAEDSWQVGCCRTLLWCATRKFQL